MTTVTRWKALPEFWSVREVRVHEGLDSDGHPVREGIHFADRPAALKQLIHVAGHRLAKAKEAAAEAEALLVGRKEELRMAHQIQERRQNDLHRESGGCNACEYLIRNLPSPACMLPDTACIAH